MEMFHYTSFKSLIKFLTTTNPSWKANLLNLTNYYVISDFAIIMELTFSLLFFPVCVFKFYNNWKFLHKINVIFCNLKLFTYTFNYLSVSQKFNTEHYLNPLGLPLIKVCSERDVLKAIMNRLKYYVLNILGNLSHYWWKQSGRVCKEQ